MSNKHMKRCSRTLIITEMQTKTTINHLTSVRMPIIKKTRNTGENVGEKGSFYTIGAATMENSMQISQKIKTRNIT